MNVNYSMFYNCDCLFIEYYDILKCPWFSLLCNIKDMKDTFKNLNLDSISFLNTDSLYEWYVNRKNRNFFLDLLPKDLIITNEIKIQLDALLDKLMQSEEIFSIDTSLNFMNILEIIKNSGLIRKIVVYSEIENKSIVDEITKMGNVNVIFGKFEDVIMNIPNNSTFVLSDISKIAVLDKYDKLRLSSILLPINYRYNKKNLEELSIDIESMKKDTVFKFNLFDNIQQYTASF